MSWDDFAGHQVQLSPPEPVDFQEGWANGEKCLQRGADAGFDSPPECLREREDARLTRWQPIKDADGKSLASALAYDEIDGYVYRTFYSAEKGSWVIGSTGEIWNPTYFIPMPAPPSKPQ